jgi:hypothetical protein
MDEAVKQRACNLVSQIWRNFRKQLGIPNEISADLN